MDGMAAYLPSWRYKVDAYSKISSSSYYRAIYICQNKKFKMFIHPSLWIPVSQKRTVPLRKYGKAIGTHCKRCARFSIKTITYIFMCIQT